MEECLDKITLPYLSGEPEGCQSEEEKKEREKEKEDEE